MIASPASRRGGPIKHKPDIDTNVDAARLEACATTAESFFQQPLAAGTTRRQCSDGSADPVVDEQHDDCSGDGYGDAVEIQAGYSGKAEETGEPSADDRSHDAEDDVQDEAFASLIYQLAADKTRNQPENDPC